MKKNLKYSIAKNKNRRLVIFILAAVVFVTNSCKKYLDAPPSKNEVIPSTLSDLQAMMENISFINAPLPELLCDDYWLTTSNWQYINSYSTSDPIGSAVVRNDALHYIWQGNAISKDSYWGTYKNVYVCNVVLNTLPKIPITNENSVEWHRIKGQALFIRSFIFWHLAQLYCKPFSSTSASTDLGLPLRLDIDFEEKSVRSSIQQTYDRILNDLNYAVQILPEATINPTRPNKAAAYGMLSRVYLSMRNYNAADIYADSCLNRNNQLMYYYTLNPSATPPIPLFNSEVIYYSNAAASWSTNPGFGFVDTSLYQTYDINDLRKTMFFRQVGNGYNFQGSYTKNYFHVFDGIATDEMYLIKAECFARNGNKDGSLLWLNTLVKTRWKNTVPYPDIVATDPHDALQKVLLERRKELCFRNLRWSDLRRYNLEGQNITLKRVIGGATYFLPPNDLKWVVLIPQDAINYSGMEQNPR